MGKNADVVLWDKNPFSIYARAEKVWVDGAMLYDRFDSAEQVASYAGLVPKQIESGTMSRFGHITRRGPSLLRSMLVESAWIVYRHNDWAQAWVHKISRGSKARRKIAIVALARRLLTILWAMLRDKTPFRAPGEAPPATIVMT